MNDLDKILKRLGRRFYKLSALEKAAIIVAYARENEGNTNCKLSLLERAAKHVASKKK